MRKKAKAGRAKRGTDEVGGGGGDCFYLFCYIVLVKRFSLGVPSTSCILLF